MKNALGHSWSLALFLLMLLTLGCDGNIPIPDGSSEGKSEGSQVPSGQPVSLRANTSEQVVGSSSSLPQRSQQTILIASFNIQAFGQSKMQDRWVMGRLAEVIRQFDIVAIQEVRSADQRLIPQLVDFVNAQGLQYDYLLGPRLGRTSSKEQYAYLYDTTRIVSDPNASYTVNDGYPGQNSKQEIGVDGLPDLLHREPLVARFVVRVMPNPFTFTLINIHTDPDEVSYELNVLDDVYKQVSNYEFAHANEDDVILLGDLNAAPAKFGELGQIPNLRPTILKQATNVRETALYDNMLIDSNRTTEFTGRVGVMSLKDYFRLTLTDAERLSDHNPIWAEFRINEQNGNGQMANQFGSFVR